MSPRGCPENRPLGRTDVAYGLLVAWKSPGGVCEGKKGQQEWEWEGVCGWVVSFFWFPCSVRAVTYAVCMHAARCPPRSRRMVNLVNLPARDTRVQPRIP